MSARGCWAFLKTYNYMIEVMINQHINLKRILSNAILLLFGIGYQAMLHGSLAYIPAISDLESNKRKSMVNSSFTIARLSGDDLNRVDELGKPERGTLGFLPIGALSDILGRGWAKGAFSPSGELVGYLLFAVYTDRFRITQLCVSRQYRNRGIARLLLDSLISEATTQKVIKLRCRRDFPAHQMWSKLGFVPLDERPGRSTAGHPLTLWCYRLASDDDLGLWRAEASDEVIDVAIDAQIFFDFDAPETHNSNISKGLLNDFLVDSLTLWITDEMFVEIDRNSDENVRKNSRERAHGFARLDYSPIQFEAYKTALQSVLPYNTESQKSDIHHLSKTAASQVSVFITKDERILNHSEQIAEKCGLRVLHPVALISSLHEEYSTQAYTPDRVSGCNLLWRPMREADTNDVVGAAFRNQGEKKGTLRESVRSYLASPVRYKSEVLFSDGEIVSFRVIDLNTQGELKVPMARVRRGQNSDLFGSFISADTVSVSLNSGRIVCSVNKTGLSDSIPAQLLKMGFVSNGDSYYRCPIPSVSSTEAALNHILSIYSQISPILETLDSTTFEKTCAPLISNQNTPCYLVPIKPAFAMGLIDHKQASGDLFGGNPNVLLRWDNVYYRTKTRHKMLQAPARIFWYASRNIGKVIAISHLDHIDSGLPKDLFRKYERYGILEWRNIYEICKKDVNREIMALKFSLTFMFKHRVSLSELNSILKEEEISASLQSPIKLTHDAAKKIFEKGFPSEL